MYNRYFSVVLLADNVVVGLKDITCPMAPVVQRIGFGDQTVFPHYLPHAAIRLEDACAQEDMSKGENEHDAEEQVVEEQQPRMRLQVPIGKIVEFRRSSTP